MPFMPVTESMFLVAETREHPMHVGGLQLFVPPGDPHEFAQEVHRKYTENSDVVELFRKRPGRPLNTVGNLVWAVDNEIDFEYHVRRTVLPSPGRIRELFQFLSLNHSTLLDRHRPMWEVHIIEGLADGRVAVYTKTHHSLVDGVSALKLMHNALSTDPEDRTGVPTWDPSLFKKRRKSAGRSTIQAITDTAGMGAKLAGEMATFAPAAARIGYRALRDSNVVLPLRAPHTMLNVPIGGARRFAAQSWSIARIRETAKQLDVTMNDMVLAMCSGALRSYLIDQNALPDEPLIAMVPVSLRKEGDESGGNQVTTILANLGTHQSEPLDRLHTVSESTKQGKQMMRELNTVQAMAFGAATMAPLLLATVPGVVRATPPPFNVIISNVPGSPDELYWNGAKLDGIYPASIVCDGQALNITVAGNGDSMNFGLVGCRRSVPHLQRMLTHLENALVELEKAV